MHRSDRSKRVHRVLPDDPSTFRTPALVPLLVIAAAALASACGGGTPPESTQAAASAAASAPASAGESSNGVEPCELLSAEQVASVLPDAAAGTTAHAGQSLIEGVDAYQCSYTNAAGGLLTVILNVAVDDARFADIRPGSAVRENREPVDAGDEGWMVVAADEVKVKATQGRTVIDVELMASGAADKSTQLVALAEAVASKIE